MRDGDIDYSRYTLRELEEALAGINPIKFPKNHANLRAAYEALKLARPSVPQAETKAATDRDAALKGDRHGAASGSAMQREETLEKLARRGLYALVMGAGAFFVYFNEIHRWVVPPEYRKLKGWWLEPIMPLLRPHLPQLVIALGIGSLGYAGYCLYRYRSISRPSA